MTISNATDNLRTLAGDDATVALPVQFKFKAASDLRVIYRQAGGDTELVLSTDYTISGTPLEGTAQVDLLIAPPATGETVFALRAELPRQETPLVTQNEFPSGQVEAQLDAIARQVGDVYRLANRAVLGDIAETTPIQLPAAASRANKLLGFDVSGDPDLLATADFTGPQGPQGDPGADGADGVDGVNGSAGADGADGVTAGVRYLFSTSTTMGDPGPGVLRFNDATLVNVTAIAIDNLSAETGNPDVSSWLASLDDSDSMTKGRITIKKATAPENYIKLKISALTDQTGWFQLTVSHVASAGALTASDPLIFEFAETGDAGAAVNVFQTIAVPAGTNPAADSSTDTLNLTTAGGRMTITGTAGTDTVDFDINVAAGFTWGGQHAFTVAPVVEITDAATATTVTGMKIRHLSSGTPAPNFGAQYTVDLHNAANALKEALRLRASWQTATAGAEDSRAYIGVLQGGSARYALVLTEAGDAYVYGSTLYIGNDQDAGNKSVNFWDDTNAAYRELRWNDTTSLLEFEDKNGAFHAVGAIGTHSIWVPAAAMVPRGTDGAAKNEVELATNKVMVDTLDFDPSTAEYAQFSVRMPKSWNEGTIQFAPVWSHPATATNFGVVWALQGLSRADGDALDAAFGSTIGVADTGGTTDDIYDGAKSSAVTLSGSPAPEDLVVFQVLRNVAHASDTMAVDARLHGVLIYFTTHAATDD